MDKKTFSMHMILAVLIAILFVGCGASATTVATTPSNEPTETPIPLLPTATTKPTPTLPTDLPTPDPEIMFEVTFDGNDCKVKGPTNLQAGVYYFTFINTSNLNGEMYIVYLDEGYTTQDLLDGQSEPSEWYPKPPWVHYDRLNSSKIEKSEGKKVNTTTWILDRVGEHTILCYVNSPRLLWIPAAIIIQETSSSE